MCDRSYPKKLAFQYLEDLKNEFERVNGAQIETAARPYAFIKFGRFLFCCLELVFLPPFLCVLSLPRLDCTFFFVFQIHSYRRQKNYTRTPVLNGIFQS